jgi:hypothetical protein
VRGVVVGQKLGGVEDQKVGDEITAGATRPSPSLGRVQEHIHSPTSFTAASRYGFMIPVSWSEHPFYYETMTP